MNKKLLVIFVSTLFVLIAVDIVVADDSAVITIPMNNDATAEIDVTPGNWTPTAGVGANESTGTGGFFTIYNNGTLMVDVEIAGEDAAWWGLSVDGNPSHDFFGLKYRLTTIGTWNTINSLPSTFIDDFARDGVKGFDLWLFMPTSTSTSGFQATNVTFTVSAA